MKRKEVCKLNSSVWGYILGNKTKKNIKRLSKKVRNSSYFLREGSYVWERGRYGRASKVAGKIPSLNLEDGCIGVGLMIIHQATHLFSTSTFYFTVKRVKKEFRKIKNYR